MLKTTQNFLLEFTQNWSLIDLYPGEEEKQVSPLRAGIKAHVYLSSSTKSSFPPKNSAFSAHPIIYLNIVIFTKVFPPREEEDHAQMEWAGSVSLFLS